VNLIDQLRRDEGVRYKPYTDTVGKLTIGVGRNLTDVGLSDAEVEFLLSSDVARVIEQLSPLAWYVALDPVRQGAVENLAFNLGINGLLHFPHFLAALAAKDWQAAAHELQTSKWAEQVGQRAVRLEQQILSGQWV
jgi:lysozyme